MMCICLDISSIAEVQVVSQQIPNFQAFLDSKPEDMEAYIPKRIAAC